MSALGADFRNCGTNRRRTTLGVGRHACTRTTHLCKAAPASASILAFVPFFAVFCLRAWMVPLRVRVGIMRTFECESRWPGCYQHTPPNNTYSKPSDELPEACTVFWLPWQRRPGSLLALLWMSRRRRYTCPLRTVHSLTELSMRSGMTLCTLPGSLARPGHPACISSPCRP